MQEKRSGRDRKHPEVSVLPHSLHNPVSHHRHLENATREVKHLPGRRDSRPPLAFLLAAGLASMPLASASAQTPATPTEIQQSVGNIVVTTATIAIDGTKNCTSVAVDPDHTERCKFSAIQTQGTFIGATIGELTGSTGDNAGEAEANKTLGTYTPTDGGWVYISRLDATNTQSDLAVLKWTFKLLIFSETTAASPGK
jgi:hypothetical protein